MSERVLYDLCRKAYSDRGSEASFDAIQKWLYDNKDDHDVLQRGANFKDYSYNMTPLHLLVMTRPPRNLVAKFIQLATHIVEVPAGDGHLPLHLACKSGASPVVVSMLLTAYPDAAEVLCEDGYLPLHYACSYRAFPDVVQVLLEAYPEATRLQDNNGCVPLHHAIRYKASTEVVKMLLDDYPEAAQVQEEDGNLPLHLACKYKVSTDVAKMVFEANPEATQEPNYDGNLPLHCACMNGVPYELLQLIANSYPEACSKKDQEGKLPSEYLKNNGAAARVDKDGMFPLHHACHDGASIHVMKLLRDAYPKAINKTDNNNKFPWDYAVTEEMRSYLTPEPQTNTNVISKLRSSLTPDYIYVNNMTDYTLQVTIGRSDKTKEPRRLGPHKKEKYRLEAGRKSALVTVKKDANRNEGWWRNTTVNQDEPLRVEGEPEIRFENEMSRSTNSVGNIAYNIHADNGGTVTKHSIISVNDYSGQI